MGNFKDAQVEQFYNKKKHLMSAVYQLWTRISNGRENENIYKRA